jgi:hypothetical protein
MWVPILVAAIALSGTSFMLWFLIALLRDSAPSTCWWIVPIRCELKRENQDGLGGYTGDDNFRSDSEPSACCVGRLENRVHAKHAASGLIALDVRRVTGRLGSRSIQPSRAIYHQRRVWLG